MNTTYKVCWCPHKMDSTCTLHKVMDTCQMGVFIHHIEKHVNRLKCNWVFVSLVSMMGSLNYHVVLPTIYQFVTNPTRENLDHQVILQHR